MKELNLLWTECENSFKGFKFQNVKEDLSDVMLNWSIYHLKVLKQFIMSYESSLHITESEIELYLT